MEKGFDVVWKNAINGIGGMPPMGTCGDCSDDEIKAAIEHMIEGI
jgi:cytochrome c5